MARWVLASRRQQTVRARKVSAARTEAAFTTLFENNSQVIGRYADDHDLHTFVAIFDADPADVQAARGRVPAADTILEPEIPHDPAGWAPRRDPLSDPLRAMNGPGSGHGEPGHATSSSPAAADRVRILGDAAGDAGGDAGGGVPLADARVMPVYDVVEGYQRELARRRAALVSRGVPRVPPIQISRQQAAALRRRSEILSRAHASVSGEDGVALLARIEDTPLTGIRVEPRSGYWSRILPARPEAPDVHLRPLPDGPLGWWHTLMGVEHYDPRRGTTIRIGVIDTGCGPHQGLAHVINLGAYVLAAHDPAGGHDVGFHGTHFCGLIGGRPLADHPGSFAGMAPGATLYSVRAFADATQPANQADLMLALRRLVTDGVDLVALGAAARLPSEILLEAIQDASDDGVLCLCPAGNDASRLRFPAAFARTAAVTAIGRTDWGPRDSFAQHFHRPPLKRKHGRPPSAAHVHRGSLRGCELFLPSFSCAGPPAVDCTAPGVGIISSVPGGDGTSYGEMSGTSTACALACGTLAGVLSAKREFFGGYNRSAERSEAARGLLDLSCQTLGMYYGFQGRGVPVLK